MIWLIGNKGMLGSDVEALLQKKSSEYIASDKEVDICDIEQLRRFAGDKKISWIVNCSAYTAVDKAEDETEAAFRINGDGVKNIALIAIEKKAKLIHISTDYVFDGTKNGPYCETDKTNPAGAYGKSKLKGEEYIRETISEYFIIRTAWLYGKNGNNFVYTMLKLFKERDEVRIVQDQWGSPTYSPDLANAILKIISDDSNKFGIYNFTNDGKTNWYEFASEIYKLALKNNILQKQLKLTPITTAEYPTKAKRPSNSYLSKDKIKEELSVECRDWKAALNDFIKDLA